MQIKLYSLKFNNLKKINEIHFQSIDLRKHGLFQYLMVNKPVIASVLKLPNFYKYCMISECNYCFGN